MLEGPYGLDNEEDFENYVFNYPLPELEFDGSVSAGSPASSSHSYELMDLLDDFFTLDSPMDLDIPSLSLGDDQDLLSFDINAYPIGVGSDPMSCSQDIAYAPHEGLGSNAAMTASSMHLSSIDGSRYGFDGTFEDASAVVDVFFAQLLERPQLFAFARLLESMRAQWRKKKGANLKAVVESLVEKAPEVRYLMIFYLTAY